MDIDRVSTAVVDRAIDQASARLRTVSALSGALLIGAGAIGYVALAVLADHLFPGGLSLHVRRAGLAVAAILIATFTATRVIWPAFRRINQLYSAWLLERARPDLRHAVTTTLLLRGRSDVHAGVSSGLAFQAARAVRHIDPTAVVPDKSLRQSGIVIIAVIAAFGLYGLLAPKDVRPSVLRVLGADVPAPTQTSVEILAPSMNVSVVVGTPVDFEVTTRGRIPEEAWVEFSLDEGRTWPPGKRLSLNAVASQSSNSATWTGMRDGADVAVTHWYRVHAGDARCETRRLEVRPQPVVIAHEVEVTWPDYSNREEATRSDGPIDALIGSKAALAVRTNVPAADGRVVFHDSAGDFSRQMSVDESDRRTLRAAWIVDRDLEYEVQFNDPHGAGNPAPIRFTQRARGDRPPEIAQSAPEATLSAALTDTFNVRARVIDDWGLSRLVLAYRGIRGSGVIDLADNLASGSSVIDIDKTISVEALGVAPGDVVELHIEASDTRVNLRGVSDPQITRGPVCELRVIGEKGGTGRSTLMRRNGSNPVSGPHKIGNQIAGGTGGPGRGSDKDGPGESGHGDETGEVAHAGAKSDAADEGAAARPGTESDNAKQPDEKGRPKQADAPGDAESGEATERGPVSQGEAPASAKPTPNGNSDSMPPDDVGAPAEEPGKAERNGDPRPMDEAAGEDPTDAQAELDRLIRKNKDAVERLSEKQSKGPGASESSAESGSEKGNSPKNGESQRADDAAHGEEPEPSRTGEAMRDSEESGEKPDAGSKGAGAAPSEKNEMTVEQPSQYESGGSGSESKSTGEKTKPAEGQTADKADADVRTEKKDRADGERTTSKDDAPPQSGDSKGEAKARPGDAQPSDKGSNGESESGEFAKNSAKNGETTDGQPGASTPKPAEGVGPPPPASEGGVAEDAGPGQPDGEFEGGARSESLDAPMRERARQAVDELERRLRDGGLSDAELRELGWSRAEARNFVTRYRRLRKAAQAQRDGGLFSGRVRKDIGSEKPSESDLTSGVGRGMAGAVRGDTRTVKDAAHAQDAPPEAVPPELRDVLDEYYRSMARQGGAKAKYDK